MSLDIMLYSCAMFTIKLDALLNQCQTDSIVIRFQQCIIFLMHAQEFCIFYQAGPMLVVSLIIVNITP